ncbi:hypothetical protein [Sinimarinibacterium flocculans]|nr:hypothetical protein [Sinimarinibacterium flocculans]
MQQLGDAAVSARVDSRWTDQLIEREKGRSSFDFERDYLRLRREATQRLESGLRHLAAEFCGAGQGTGKIVDRDVRAWALRLCGSTASETAHIVGTSRRTITTSADKVTSAVKRAADLCGDKIAAVRDALLEFATGAGYLSASPAPYWDAAELRELAVLIDVQERSRRASWPKLIDVRPVVEALLKIDLVALITPAALLAISPAAGLPDAAFDPRGFLRRLVRRSRLGKPPQPSSVLSAYMRAAKKREHVSSPWDEDPAFVLVTGLSLVKNCLVASEPEQLLPPRMSATCRYCWKPADRNVGRCHDHLRVRTKPRYDDEFQRLARSLMVEAGRIEGQLLRSPQYSSFARYVLSDWEAGKQWRLADRKHSEAIASQLGLSPPSAASVSHAKRTLEDLQNATIDYMVEVEERGVELHARTIYRIAYEMVRQRVRARHLAIGFLMAEQDAVEKTRCAAVGKRLGISRQEVWRAKEAAERAVAKAGQIIADAIPLPDNLIRTKERVDMQRRVMLLAVCQAVLGPRSLVRADCAPCPRGE